MFLSKKTWETERTARIRAEEMAKAIHNQNTALQVTMDWQRVRLTQLEHERAVLIERYMGIKISVPDVQTETKDDSSILMEVPSFNDVGDDMAAKLGVGWDENGELTVTGKR